MEVGFAEAVFLSKPLTNPLFYKGRGGVPGNTC